MLIVPDLAGNRPRETMLAGLLIVVALCAPMRASAYLSEATRFAAEYGVVEQQFKALAKQALGPQEMADRQRGVLEQAMTDGNVAARCLLAERYFYGGEFWPKDAERAVRLMTAKDISFCPHGYRILANAYRDGIGVPPSPADAEFWYRTAVASQSGLISAFEKTTPNDVEDLIVAQRWFNGVVEAGPDAGLAAARKYLPRMPSPDGGHLVYILLFAAQPTDHPEVSFTLGRAILEGKVTMGRQSEGRMWLRMAARHDHPEAQIFLARQLITQSSSPSRYFDAHIWLSRARDNGADVSRLLDETVPRLSERDRLQAETRARRKDFPWLTPSDFER